MAPFMCLNVVCHYRKEESGSCNPHRPIRDEAETRLCFVESLPFRSSLQRREMQLHVTALESNLKPIRPNHLLTAIIDQHTIFFETQMIQTHYAPEEPRERIRSH